MPKHNRDDHTVKEDGTIILHSNHLGDVIEVGIDKVKRRFYGIREDKTIVEDTADCGNDFAQRVMLYRIYYSFANDCWGLGYRVKGQKKNNWLEGFKTAREAWLYREALIAGGIAKR